MSDQNPEVMNLQKQLEQRDGTLKVLGAQLEAHKGMLNEALQASLNLRTNLVMLQQNNQEMANKHKTEVEVLKAQVESLNQQLTDATAKIAELSAVKIVAA